MKRIYTFADFINESLEKPYPFKIGNSEYNKNGLSNLEFVFNSPTQQYKVVFYAVRWAGDEGKFDMVFGLDQGTSFIDTHQMTGEGNVRIIIKTVASIIEKFLYYAEDYFSDTKVIIDATDEKRRRLYKTLFPKYLPSKIMTNNIILK